MQKLAIIGTKEFAFQIRDFALQLNQFEFVGYIDNVLPVGTEVEGKKVLGTVSEAISLYQQHIFDCIFIAVGYTHFELREAYYNQLAGHIPFANIIMPNVKLGLNVRLGEGIFIGENTQIGNNTIINNNVFMHGDTHIAHDNVIGEHTYISGRFNTAGFVTIGKRNFLGIGILISDHISICDDAWLGLGCIVAKDITIAGKYMSPSARLYRFE
ncbi:MAG: hypothetical protein MJZ92_00855 [Paludibacteraceae bacterium]|nr:hypothetical protein [Paludibacteraceae bacterium]